MIEFCDVTYRYHYDKYPLFEGLSFVLPAGQNTVLCDMQSGKTSLCKMILGTLPPQSGSVTVQGVDIYANPKHPAVPDVLYLPSHPTFFQNKTVAFNLEYPLRVRKLPVGEQVAALAERFGLENLLSAKVKKLDLRQKRLLALARGLTVPRNIVLLDGFFDDTLAVDQLAPSNVLPLLTAPTKVVFTADPAQAVGNTVVLDGKKCVFSGDSLQATEAVASLTWLAREVQQQHTT